MNQHFVPNKELKHLKQNHQQFNPKIKQKLIIKKTK